MRQVFSGIVTMAAVSAVTASASGEIPITILNTWQAPYAQQILGMSVQGEMYVFRSNLDGKIIRFNPDDGAYIGELAIPTAYRSGFGVALLGDGFYIDCDTSPYIYHNPGAGAWDSFPNPAAVGGRGLSNDPSNWTSIVEGYSWAADRGSFAFEGDGTGSEYSSLEGIWGTISGIAAHWVAVDGQSDQPYAMVVTSSDQHEFMFYFRNGSSYYLYGQEPCPVEVQQSLGLAFAPYRDSFFWSYIGMNGQYYVSELFMPILGDLESTTWGSLKSGFGN